eukprot:6388992-Pyramimonas_sp.AAC.1
MFCCRGNRADPPVYFCPRSSCPSRAEGVCRPGCPTSPRLPHCAFSHRAHRRQSPRPFAEKSPS